MGTAFLFALLSFGNSQLQSEFARPNYESVRQQAIDNKISLYVWVGVPEQAKESPVPGFVMSSIPIYDYRGFHAVKPNGWQGIQGPAYVIGEYKDGKLWWKKVVDLRPRPPVQC